MTDLLPVTQADRDAVQAFHRTMAARLMADITSKDRPKLGEDEGDAGTLVQAFARHRLEALRTQGDGERWQHVKRGTVYEVVGRAELQTISGALVDGSEMVVYRGDDGKLWCREYGEFEDGRFTRISAPTQASSREGGE